MELSRPQYWNGKPFPSLGDLPNPGIKAGSPALQVDSLPAGPQGKTQNTEVGSLSLLQRIFPTQKLNWGLLHYKWILYKVNYHFLLKDLPDLLLSSKIYTQHSS